ncbi:Bug family tripartite tricarboxylate transporter substrate binding protein [Pseudochelatococcus sp. B33]
MPRTYLFAAVSLGLSLAFGVPALAEYPSKPVTMVVPFGPGGGNDMVARYLADHLAKLWGQTVVVENKPGAGTAIGTAYVANAAPDGQTLLFVSNTFTTTAAAQANLPYDAATDLVPVAMSGKVPMGLVTGPKTPAKTVAELIEAARSKELLYATSGPGTINHFGAELFNDVAGINARPVHYKGGNEALTALMGGEIDMFFSSFLQLESFISAGQVNGLMVTGPERVRSSPDLPTPAEAGVGGSEVELWWGVFAPADTPPETVAMINDRVNEIMQSDETREFLAKNGATPTVMTADEFAAAVSDELTKWKEIASKADLGLEAQ